MATSIEDREDPFSSAVRKAMTRKPEPRRSVPDNRKWSPGMIIAIVLITVGIVLMVVSMAT